MYAPSIEQLKQISSILCLPWFIQSSRTRFSVNCIVRSVGLFKLLLPLRKIDSVKTGPPFYSNMNQKGQKKSNWEALRNAAEPGSYDSYLWRLPEPHHEREETRQLNSEATENGLSLLGTKPVHLNQEIAPFPDCKLDGSSIRLLQVLPGKDNESIEC